MSETASDAATVEMHSSIESDAEFMALFHATTTGEGRPLAKWDAAVCDECRRGDAVETERRDKGLATLRRHTCTRCGTHGATVIEAQMGNRDARLWTKGDVRTVDLAQEENADARGTF